MVSSNVLELHINIELINLCLLRALRSWTENSYKTSNRVTRICALLFNVLIWLRLCNLLSAGVGEIIACQNGSI